MSELEPLGEKSAIEKYIELHEEWSGDPDKNEMVSALSTLVAADTISAAIRRSPTRWLPIPMGDTGEYSPHLLQFHR